MHRCRKDTDGRIEMRLETTGRKELVRWILSWMPDVKALEPKTLADRIVEKLQSGLQAQ
ncbi:MAG: WYL domain-containing protein [bacterium]